MDSVNFYIVDVFAKEKYQGNQLAVFVDMESRISDRDMQAIAREINFAETTFIKRDTGRARFEVRIFTPEHEVPFAGHPSIGTSYIISKFLLPEAKRNLTLALLQGDITITVMDPGNLDESIVYMQQAQPGFHETFTHGEIAEELAINPEHLNSLLPIQEITTGLPYIIIPVASLQAIENIQPDYHAFRLFLLKRKKHRSNSTTGHSTSLFFLRMKPATTATATIQGCC